MCDKNVTHMCHYFAYICRIYLSHMFDTYVTCICLSNLHTCVLTFVLVRRPVWDWFCKGGNPKHNTVSSVVSTMVVHGYSFLAWVP